MKKEKKYVVIVLKPNKKPELVYLNSKSVPFPTLRELCECDVITICNTYEYNKVFDTDYCIVCDDNGLLVDRPILNPVASVLYSSGQYLAGTCLVLRNARGNEEPDCYAIDEDEADKLFYMLTLTHHILGG